MGKSLKNTAPKITYVRGVPTKALLIRTLFIEDPDYKPKFSFRAFLRSFFKIGPRVEDKYKV